MNISGVNGAFTSAYQNINGARKATKGDTGFTEQMDRQKSETEIIVRPDGSRVLVMTMNVGGMKTTMSLEISKPTKLPYENSKQDTDNGRPFADDETNAVSDKMTNISTEDWKNSNQYVGYSTMGQHS